MASMISTSDNPYNPFTDFKRWFAFDTFYGYNSCQYLAKIAAVSPDIDSEIYEQMIDQACDEIVALNLTGNRIKVTA